MAMQYKTSDPSFSSTNSRSKIARKRSPIVVNIGESSSGKTQHFDCCIRRFESYLPSHKTLKIVRAERKHIAVQCRKGYSGSDNPTSPELLNS